MDSQDYRWWMKQMKLGAWRDPQVADRFAKLSLKMAALTTPNDDIIRTPIHEAAHVVSAYAIGGFAHWVYINEDGTGRYSATLPGPDLDQPAILLADLDNLAITRSAGPVAEEIKWQFARKPESGPMGTLIGEITQRLQRLQASLQRSPNTDVQSQLTYLEGLPPIHAAIAISEKGENRARKILENRWPEVELIAQALIANRRLERTEIERILAITSSIPK